MYALEELEKSLRAKQEILSQNQSSPSNPAYWQRYAEIYKAGQVEILQAALLEVRHRLDVLEEVEEGEEEEEEDNPTDDEVVDPAAKRRHI